MTIRIYERVSTSGQKTDAQHGELEAWAEMQTKLGHVVIWYKDKFSGKTMNRPGFAKLEKESKAGDTVCVWRLDRLGRTPVGLLNLLKEWQDKGIVFKSLRDAIDQGSASGRLFLNMLISFAAFETELRSERIMAARQTKLARGEAVNLGGRKKGANHKTTPAVRALVLKLRREGEPVSKIAKLTRLSRPTIYAVLATI